MNRKKIFYRGFSPSVSKQLKGKKYQGKVVGLADGRIVESGKSIKIVANKLTKNYRGHKLSLLTVPKKNKILVL